MPCAITTSARLCDRPDAADSHRHARVTVDPSVRDKWGLAGGARLQGNCHPHTFEIGDIQAKRAEAWLKEAGAIDTSLMTSRPEVRPRIN